MKDERQLYIHTPQIFSHPLSNKLKTNVYLKLEALQPSGSFKNRGIGHFISQNVKQGAKEFVCSSGGNAGLAAAFAARQLEVPLTVFVPLTTPELMVNKIRSEGTIVVQKGTDWQEADNLARKFCKEHSAVYVSPFDHPLIWEGNATIIHEVEQTGLKPDVIVVAVGGGGLFCGIIQGLHDIGWKDVPVFAVETEGAASFAAAMQAGKVVEIESIDTVAKSLGARAVSQQAVKWMKNHEVYSKVVSDQAAVDACRMFSDDHRILVEPACGAALSLCYDPESELRHYQNTLVIVCGGACII